MNDSQQGAGALAPSAKLNTGQPIITGYRNLSQDEIALINDLKQLGEVMNSHLGVVRIHLDAQLMKAKDLANTSADPDATARAKMELARIQVAEAGRWLAIARTHLQEGQMAMVRAVAQPGGF